MARPGGMGTKGELLNVLSDVKAKVMDKLGKKDFPMPQFILVGKQSVGKSRLIEALAGEQFNFISGTLGSRRPTCLEFRNVSNLPESKWFVRDLQTLTWAEHPIQQVMKIIGEAHECLGHSVTKEAVYVRIESPACVDMQIVDLPGFRDFASTDEAKVLQNSIQELVGDFMRDPKNVMLCVEQAGDAANMSTLARCKEVDPNYERTVLIRNKLDKFYRDLTPENVSQWTGGYGDINKKLLETTFSLTLPWWPDDKSGPPKPFPAITEEKNNEDLTTLTGKGLGPNELKHIGFKNFVAFMDKKVERMFSDAIEPVLTSLRELEGSTVTRQKELKIEFEDTDPSRVLNTTRNCGKTFALALADIMKGVMGLENPVGQMDLEEELRNFHEHHEAAGSHHFMMLPSPDFTGLDDYLEYLRTAPFMATFDQPLSGGAQFRRLLMEVEVFLRFSEVAADTKKRDVIQARGVSMTSLTWRDVVVKLLSAEAHVPLKERVQYVGERVTYFFESQKAVILGFMNSCKGGHSAFFSADYGPHGHMISSNPMMKHLIYEAYDRVARRQLGNFMELFQNMLTSTFANPWTFLKGGTEVPDTEDITVPMDSEMRIPKEIQHRSGMETTLNLWLQNIPTDDIDQAVDEVQKLVLRIYSLIRSQVCDQVELFTESFFKTPMLRELGADMSSIQLTEDDKLKYKERRDKNQKEAEQCTDAIKEVKECIQQLENFKFQCQAASQYGL